MANKTRTDAPGALKLIRLTLADAAPEAMAAAVSVVRALFLEREAEFGVHPSVVIVYPDLTDGSPAGFLGDAPAFVSARAEALAADGSSVGRIVVLTTFGDVVGASFAAAGYRTIRIDMPAGPDHTTAFVRGPDEPPVGTRTLYVEAVDEVHPKIEPTFALRLIDGDGGLVAGACGAVRALNGKHYAYLATMAAARDAPIGTGTLLMAELVRFLREKGVATLHLGTQTADAFYEKSGFRVTHRLVRGLRTRRKEGREILGDLVMLAMDL